VVLPLTLRSLAKSAQQAHAAEDLARAKLQPAPLKLPGGSGKKMHFWGQFTDPEGRKSGQIGIYGTASVAGILRLDENPARRSRFHDAILGLPGWSGSDPSSPLDHSELQLALKCAALMEAWAGDLGAENQRGVEESLVRAAIAGRGWGYVSGELDPAAEQEVLPTAQVLAGICVSSTTFRENHLALFEDSYAWLIDTLRSPNLTTLEKAFGLIALARGKRFVANKPLYDEALKRTVEDLVAFTKRRPRLLVEYYEHVHYPAPSVTGAPVSGQSHKNRYMFYPVDTIVALALLESENHQLAPRYVKQVADVLTKHIIKTDGYFQSAATKRPSSADAFWVVRLLAAYRGACTTQPTTLVPAVTGGLRLPWVRWPLLLVSLCLAIVAAVGVAVSTEADVRGYFAALGVISGFLIPLIIWLSPSRN